MSDYLGAETKNIQLLLDNTLKEAKKNLIEEFRQIKNRIIKKMILRYGTTAKGIEYLENLFEEELKKLK